MYYYLVLYFILSALSQSKCEVFVSTSGTVGAAGTALDPVSTISEAITKVTDGQIW